MWYDISLLKPLDCILPEGALENLARHGLPDAKTREILLAGAAARAAAVRADYEKKERMHSLSDTNEYEEHADIYLETIEADEAEEEAKALARALSSGRVEHRAMSALEALILSTDPLLAAAAHATNWILMQRAGIASGLADLYAKRATDSILEDARPLLSTAHKRAAIAARLAQ